MSLRDKIPQVEMLEVVGEQVRLVPPSYSSYLDLQEWISNHAPSGDSKGDKRTQEEFGVLFMAKCIQIVSPDEELSDEEAVRVLIMTKGATGVLANKAIALCGSPMEKETAAELPSS